MLLSELNHDILKLIVNKLDNNARSLLKFSSKYFINRVYLVCEECDYSNYTDITKCHLCFHFSCKQCNNNFTFTCSECKNIICCNCYLENPNIHCIYCNSLLCNKCSYNKCSYCKNPLCQTHLHLLVYCQGCKLLTCNNCLIQSKNCKNCNVRFTTDDCSIINCEYCRKFKNNNIKNIYK